MGRRKWTKATALDADDPLSSSIARIWRLAYAATAVISTCSAVTACGGEVPDNYFGSFETVAGAPSYPADAPTMQSLDGEQSFNGLTAIGPVVDLGSETGLWRVDTTIGTTLSAQPLEVLKSDAADPDTTGKVSWLGIHEGRTLALAEQGLFESYSQSFIVVSTLTGIIEATEGELSGLHVASDGDFWFGEGSSITHAEKQGSVYAMTSFQVEGETSAATVLLDASSEAGEILLAAFDDHLYEIDLATNTAYPVPIETGTIFAMAPGLHDTSYIATERGLFERWPSHCYKHYTLSDGASSAAFALSYSPKDGTFVLLDTGIVLARPDSELQGMASLDQLGFAKIAVGAALANNGAGTVWSTSETSVRGADIGEATSFAADVEPILVTYCSPCHAEGANSAPAVDFADYQVSSMLAGDIIQRIASGNMPPAGEPAPSKDEFQLIQAWSIGGLAE